MSIVNLSGHGSKISGHVSKLTKNVEFFQTCQNLRNALECSCLIDFYAKTSLWLKKIFEFYTSVMYITEGFKSFQDKNFREYSLA